MGDKVKTIGHNESHRIELSEVATNSSERLMVIKLKVINEGKVSHKFLDRADVNDLILKLTDLERKMYIESKS